VDDAESFSAPPEEAYKADSRSLCRQDVWEIIKEVGLMERHFHQMQNHYRLLASTWTLAVFAATGFLLASNELHLISLPKELAMAGLAVFGGITLLWIMDLRIYGMLISRPHDSHIRTIGFGGLSMPARSGAILVLKVFMWTCRRSCLHRFNSQNTLTTPSSSVTRSTFSSRSGLITRPHASHLSSLSGT
jgi:hypothetical protein